MTDIDEKRILDTPSTKSSSTSSDPAVEFPKPSCSASTMPAATDEVHTVASSPEEPLVPQSNRHLRKRIMSLELPVFLLFLALMITGPVMLNQELYQTCVAVYHYNESSCEPLRGIIPKTEEAKVRDYHSVVRISGYETPNNRQIVFDEKAPHKIPSTVRRRRKIVRSSICGTTLRRTPQIGKGARPKQWV